MEQGNTGDGRDLKSAPMRPFPIDATVAQSSDRAFLPKGRGQQQIIEFRATRSAPNQIQVMRYMGNKRGVLEFLIPLLDDEVPKGEPVLDIFAGTGAVSYALKDSHIIYANDLQHYSYVICQALLAPRSILRTIAGERKQLQDRYEYNFERLEEIFGETMEKEAAFLGRRLTKFNYPAYRAFVSRYPFYNGPGSPATGKTEFLKWFSEETLGHYRSNRASFPSILFSIYFANGYFGVRQCMEIDSIRYAIDGIEDESQKCLCLTALISAVSAVVSSTGHFAEFRVPNSTESAQSLLEERKKWVRDLFFEKLDEMQNSLVDNCDPTKENKCFNIDYTELLTIRRDEVEDACLVYADPPYTTANYSRFYHVLETLTRYDYPNNDFIGRYRHDRVCSDFCKYSTVREAFSRLCRLTSSLGADLAISYSSRGMIGIEEIRAIAERHYCFTKFHEKEYSHSRQGRKSKMDVREYVLICRRPY